MTSAMMKFFRFSPIPMAPPVNMLAEKKVKPIMMTNIDQKPLRAPAGMTVCS